MPTTSSLDRITERHTAFRTFDDLIGASHFWPSLRVDDPERRVLADAYDRAQKRAGDKRRAFRIKLGADGRTVSTLPQIQDIPVEDGVVHPGAALERLTGLRDIIGSLTDLTEGTPTRTLLSAAADEALAAMIELEAFAVATIDERPPLVRHHALQFAARVARLQRLALCIEEEAVDLAGLWREGEADQGAADREDGSINRNWGYWGGPIDDALDARR